MNLKSVSAYLFLLWLSFLGKTELRMFVLCSLFLFDFLFSPKVRGVFLYFFPSPEVFPDGAVFSWLRQLTYKEGWKVENQM